LRILLSLAIHFDVVEAAGTDNGDDDKAENNLSSMRFLLHHGEFALLIFEFILKFLLLVLKILLVLRRFRILQPWLEVICK
jgi:hypothetical protein